MDGGQEAVNEGLLKVAKAFKNVNTYPESLYIETYNSAARDWRELNRLATRPNVHRTAGFGKCPACRHRSAGCAECAYSGMWVDHVECELDNCETCQFQRLCKNLDVRLYNMPKDGPWRDGYVQPPIPAGKTREGRFRPGELIVLGATREARDVGYVAAVLDTNAYAVAMGRQYSDSGRTPESWGAPQFSGTFQDSTPRACLYRCTVDRNGVEIMATWSATAAPVVRLEIQLGWAIPTRASLHDIEDVGELIATYR